MQSKLRKQIDDANGPNMLNALAEMACTELESGCRKNKKDITCNLGPHSLAALPKQLALPRVLRVQNVSSPPARRSGAGRGRPTEGCTFTVYIMPPALIACGWLMVMGMLRVCRLLKVGAEAMFGMPWEPWATSWAMELSELVA